MPFSVTDPIQPFWVFDSAAYYKKKSKIPAIAHFYKFQGSSGISSSYAVPDGAIDIILECEGGSKSARICGPVNRGSNPGFKEDKTYFGIRLHPELLTHIGDAPIADLAGQEYALEDLVRDSSRMDILEQIAEEQDFGKQAALFEDLLMRSSENTTRESAAHHLTMAVISEIYEHRGLIRVKDLETELNYSRRHLTRSFSETMGMDIKTFSNYVRFQYILHGIRDGQFEKAADAAMAGDYYDQSHFQKDFRSFTHTTPYRLIRLFRESDYKKRIILLE